ncbi:MAG: DNA polymerase III subunit beta [Intestinimonas sp.]
MKFSCEKALLQSAIAVTARAVSPKSSIPALEGILLEAGTDLRLTGYNLETGIRTVVPAQIDQEGSLVLSARLFGEIIRKLPDDIVSFQADGYMVNITCGMSQFNILATDPEDFPELPTVEDKNGFTIPRGKLGSMIRQTIFCRRSDNESRPIHAGSLFEIDDTGLTVVSVGRLPAGSARTSPSRSVTAPSLLLRRARSAVSQRWRKSAATVRGGYGHAGRAARHVPRRGYHAGSPAVWRVNFSLSAGDSRNNGIKVEGDTQGSAHLD